MKSIGVAVSRIFFLLIIIFLPLDFFHLNQIQLTHFVFGGFIQYCVDIFSNNPHLRIDFSSDSLSMYLLIGYLLLLAIVFSSFRYLRKIVSKFEFVFPFYLGLILLKYGLDKVFKAQFYLPEPNILFTRFGNLDRDILFWSTMGISYSYSFILGLIEVVVAVLLFIPRTRLLGAVLSSFVFLQIVIINFSFDISVKLFSTILLLMSVFVARKGWILIFTLFLNQGFTNLPNIKIQRFILATKTFLICWILWNCFVPFLEQKQFNDDYTERPFLHGAYKNTNNDEKIKYIFFHRNQYMIFMDEDENQTDFKYSIKSDTLFLEDYNGIVNLLTYKYQQNDSILIMQSLTINIKAKSLNWQNSKALQPLFHLMIEDVK